MNAIIYYAIFALKFSLYEYTNTFSTSQDKIEKLLEALEEFHMYWRDNHGPFE